MRSNIYNNIYKCDTIFVLLIPDRTREKDKESRIALHTRNAAISTKLGEKIYFVRFLTIWHCWSGSWFYFGFQYQPYISYIVDTRQILFGSANSFESYCVHSQNSRTYSQTTRQIDRQTRGIFFACFVF